MSRTPADALVLRDITFAHHGKPPTLRGVSLSVPRGAMTVILGANGSGKTTLMRIAAGLVRPQQGAAAMGDGTPTARAMRRGRIGYIPQHLGLVRSASVLDNVLAGGISRAPLIAGLVGVMPASMRDEASAALDNVGMRQHERRPVKDLSGGERQRVAIARTLMQRPEVLIADELIASLDAVQAQAVMELLRRLKQQGVGLLLSLHHIDVALSNADHITFLANGALTPPRTPEGMTAEDARCALLA